MTFSCTFNSELGWRYACSKCCGGRPQKGIWAKGKPWGWRAIKWPGGNSHLVFPKNCWYGMPFAAREGRAGSKAVGRRREEPSWTSGSEVSTGTPGAGRRAPGQDGWRSAERGPEGTTAKGRERQRTRGPFPRLLQVLWPDTASPATEPRVPEKRSVGGCGAGSWGSGSQQEACSWPLEPQEGEQAPGKGGSEGVDEFL